MLSSIVDLSHHTTNTSWPDWHDVDVQHVLKKLRHQFCYSYAQHTADFLYGHSV